MGEVYRAEDTKLGREVAIKVLPEAFTTDSERLARFKREARVLASLNHPNIGGIHGLEEADGVRALVLELVEGPTLADRIADSRIPLEESLAIARQIAEALEAAHEQGIIHRDLKPANVKVRSDGTVKVLDFGLAKALEPGADDPEISQSPTLSLPAAATQMGVILGTAAYMSPEQARGRSVDKRADIWAFGCLLYEMLTRKRPFAGEDVSETLARVIEREPDFQELPDAAPPALVRLIERCLRKDPRQRLHDIADARLEIEDAMAFSPADSLPSDLPKGSTAWRVAPWVIAALTTVVALAGFFRGFWTGPADSVTRAHLQVVLPEGLQLAVDTAHPTLALSPDGTQLVFVGDDGQSRKLYLRDLAEGESRGIPGTEGGASPFFSPDGDWIGFFVGSNLVKVSAVSGAPVAVHATTGVRVNRGATWVAEQKVVIAGSPNSGLSLTSIEGQDFRPLAEMIFLTDIEAPHSWPSSLPDGGSLVFNDSTDANLDAPALKLLRMDSGEIVRLDGAGSNPRVSASGHLLYARDGSLYGMQFDERQKGTTGAEFRIIDGVITDANGAAQYAVGGKGTLAYVGGPSDSGRFELVWVDREGDEETMLRSDLPMRLPRLSPDGSQVAVTLVDGANVDVWLVDSARRSLDRRLTTHPGEDFGAVWHPEGRALVLGSEVSESADNKGPAIGWIEEIGQAPSALAVTPGWGNWEFPSSWSPDGQWVAFVAIRDGGSADILLISPENPEEVVPFLETPAREWAPMFSPDGRWMAYVSDDTGSPEVYAQPFPGPGDRRRISIRNGTEPLWSRDGREIFYREGRRLMVVLVDGSGERLEASEPQLLIDTKTGSEDLSGLGASTANYDVSLDGSRFLIIRRENPMTATVIDVVLNWRETLGVQ